jgi:PAS domain S-box-containing protein
MQGHDKTQDQLIEESNEMRQRSTMQQRAEGKLSRSSDRTQEFKDKTPEEIIHELQVHQIELETQSEELKRVQLELEKSRDNYRDKYADLYDFAPVGYLTLTYKGLIEEVNLTGATLLGMPRQKLIERGFGHFVTSENLARWDQHIISVLGHEEAQTCDLWLKREDGSLFYARLRSIRRGEPPKLEQTSVHVIATVITDITERKQSEEALESANAYNRTLIETSIDPLVTISADGRISDVNTATETVTGYRRDELIGTNFSDYFTDPDMAMAGYQQVFQDGLVKDYELEIQHRDGHVTPVIYSASVYRDKSGEVVGVFAAARDITERKRLEEERSNLIVELQNALSEVKKLSGFLPICACCKKIRDDTGYWNEIERYIGDHSEAQFSHGICPDCMRKLYPEEADEILGPLEKDQEK